VPHGPISGAGQHFAVKFALTEGYDRQGSEALNDSSWREYITMNFEPTQSHLYRPLDAGRIEQSVSPTGEVDRIPDRHLRPLAHSERLGRVER
jgi:hypothetical protein